MQKKLYLFFTFVMLFSYVHSENVNWSTSPEVLSGAGINAADPQIAIDANGNAVSAWIENNTVKAKTKLFNGNWSSPVTLSATGASSIKLVSDSNGNATAVWVESNIIKAASKTLNGNWSASVSLSATTASSPSLSVGISGDIIAAWVRSGNVETSTKRFGMSWQSRVIVNSTAAANPVVNIGGSGANTRAVLVWQGTSSGTNAVFSSTKLVTGNWNSPKVISELEQSATKPYAAIDSNGNATALWYAYSNVGTTYFNVIVKSSSYSATDGTWGAVSDLSLPGMRNPETLKALVAFDTIGNAIALWNTSFDDETFTLQSAVKPVNNYWSTPVDLVNSNTYAFSADLSVTSFGDVLGLYMFYNGASLMIQSVESDANGFLNNFWSVPITISLGANNAYPKIAASISGNVIYAAAVWLNNNGINNQVIGSTGSKTLVNPPSNLHVTQSIHNFGVFSEYYNTLSWTASVDTSTIGYLIFRNGIFIDEVDAGTVQFIDNNRTLNGPVVYGLTAINDHQTQSPLVAISFP
jgi:hypothetical protein